MEEDKRFTWKSKFERVKKSAEVEDKKGIELMRWSEKSDCGFEEWRGRGTECSL
ncbi:MAG: hypothetical protein ACLP1Y_13025 [Candidatus Acidiferrales bacterium]